MATAIRIERLPQGFIYDRSDRLTGDEARTLAAEIKGIDDNDELQAEDDLNDSELTNG